MAKKTSKKKAEEKLGVLELSEIKPEEEEKAGEEPIKTFEPVKESFFKKNKDILFKVWVVVSLVIVFILLVPTKTETREVEVQYTGEENYTQEIPYDVQEPFEVKLWYESGSDCVDDPDCLCISKSTTTGECMRCTCNVDINSTREIGAHQIMTVLRNVTKYKEFNQTRTAVKTRMEQQQREVNWIFGFGMPYKLHLPLISG